MLSYPAKLEVESLFQLLVIVIGHEMLVLIASVQVSLINAHVVLSSNTRGREFVSPVSNCIWARDVGTYSQRASVSDKRTCWPNPSLL